MVVGRKRWGEINANNPESGRLEEDAEAAVRNATAATALIDTTAAAAPACKGRETAPAWESRGAKNPAKRKKKWEYFGIDG